MGNTLSSPNQPMDMKSLSSQIDDIAVHYILKQNTIDLLRLTDKEYYDNLIVLVGNLFEKRLTDIEIGSLNQRIFPETVQDAVLNLLPSSGKIKDNMISSISKFYIKIMMIFSAIVATIDPQYSYEDDTGTKQLFYLKDIHSYKNIPRNVQPMVHQLTNPMNLCRKRISILRNKIDLTDPDFITINPGEKICSTDSTGRLTDEVGIKELDLLYYDIFDPSSKTWKSRSKEMEEKYREDLKKFYTIFTGKSDMPKNITSFKEIELFDFKSIEYCRDGLFTHDFIIPKENELIMRYKEQVELLEQSTSQYRTELLDYIKKIFLTKIENETTTYTIQPSLTLNEILKIEQDTRNTIINLYTNCEQYFIRALLIFEELYDNQSKNVNESRMENLENNRLNVPLYTEGLIHTENVMNKPSTVPVFSQTIQTETPDFPQNYKDPLFPNEPSTIPPPNSVPVINSLKTTTTPPINMTPAETNTLPMNVTPDQPALNMPPNAYQNQQNTVPMNLTPEQTQLNTLPLNVTPEPTNTLPLNVTPELSAPSNTVSNPYQNQQNAIPMNVTPEPTQLNTMPINITQVQPVQELTAPVNTVQTNTFQEQPAPLNTLPTNTVPTNTFQEQPIPELTAPVNTMPANTVQEQPVPLNTMPANTVQYEPVPVNTMPTNTMPANTVPTNTVQEQPIPLNTMPANTVPTNTVQEQPAPVNTLPTNTVQEQPAPVNTLPTNTPVPDVQAMPATNKPEEPPKDKPEEKNTIIDQIKNIWNPK